MDPVRDDANEIAIAFVDLVGECDQKTWKFHDEAYATAVMLTLVQSAGFKATSVMPGMLRGNYLDQDGSKTGETYVVNSFPYKVLGSNGNDFGATIWLDAQFHPVRGNGMGLTRLEIIENLVRAIRDSRPLTPIILTDVGDALREYPVERVTAKHHRDDDSMATGTGCVGVHDACNGFVDRRGASTTHDSLNCRGCNLRICIPKSVKTYGDLRRHLAQFNG